MQIMLGVILGYYIGVLFNEKYIVISEFVITGDYCTVVTRSERSRASFIISKLNMP